MKIRLKKYCPNFVAHECDKAFYFAVHFRNPCISIWKIHFSNIFTLLCDEIISHKFMG